MRSRAALHVHRRHQKGGKYDLNDFLNQGMAVGARSLKIVDLLQETFFLEIQTNVHEHLNIMKLTFS